MGIFDVIYLHGFLSSPQSAKASLIRAAVANYLPEVSFCCPDLAKLSPAESISLVDHLIKVKQGEGRSVILMGSSLGGFYATYLAEKFLLPALLINPGVRPWEQLIYFLGPQKLYGRDEWIVVQPDYFQELKNIAVSHVREGACYWLMAATHDEIIPYRDMCQHYPTSKLITLQNENHAVDGFSKYIDKVIDFIKKQKKEERR
jgi:predicted esterase YcpF (UPF0227 family)